MKKTVNMSAAVIVLLAIAVVTMSFGFASITAQLNINGTAKVAKSTWSVHFVNTGTAANDLEATSGSITTSDKAPDGSTPAVTHTIDNTTWTFTAYLNEPGDFYEYTAEVTNDGTLNAQLTKITMTALDANQAKYLTYKVYYNGTEYTATTNNLTTALNAGATVPVKVRVEYVLPANASELPSSDQSITLTTTLDYIQVD